MRVPLARRADRQAAVDSVCEVRLAQVHSLVEAFTYSLALIIAGCEADIESITDGQLASRLRASLAPYVKTGRKLRPDFGAYGDLKIEGDLLRVDQPVAASVEFVDRTHDIAHPMNSVATTGRRIRLTLMVELQPPRIVDCIVSILASVALL